MSQHFFFISVGSVMAVVWALALSQPPVRTETSGELKNFVQIKSP